MHFLHGFLCWLIAHCWSCRFGASWRQRRDPASAGRVFLSPSFLRFSLFAMLVEILPAIATYATVGGSRACMIALIAAAGGVATGVVHGSAAYD
jgi:hypothetical protein